LGPIPNPQSPIPNPHPQEFIITLYLICALFLTYKMYMYFF
jgi:hypothetical protein